MTNQDFLKICQKYLPFSKSEIGLDENANLREQGLDSLKSISLMLEIEETYEFEFPDEYLTMDVFNTAGSLWMAVQKILQK